MDDKPVSNRFINHHPNGLSAAIQMDYKATIQMEDQPLYPNRIINQLSKWIISLLSKWMINLYQTGLSTTIQMDYQPLSKWMINLYQIGLSTTIQMDYQQLSKWIISYYPNG